MIIDVLVIAIFLSIIFKRIKIVLSRDIKLIYLMPIPFILQILPFYKSILLPVSFLLLLFILWKNRHLPGIKLMFIGAVLNGFVMSISGGKMPVLESIAELMKMEMDSRHYFTNWKDWRILFGDWIPAPLPYGRKFIISLGDIFIFIGIFIFFLSKKEKLPNKGS
ncbi:MAG: DUF5317 family protein [Thermotogaceae bacterium]|nr:DUF5317 family protein [Thermotogaceae bacterium]